LTTLNECWSLTITLVGASCREPNYEDCGKGSKGEAWEKELVKDVDTFWQNRKSFQGQSEAGFFVGDKLTMADFAMLIWPWSFHLIVELKIETTRFGALKCWSDFQCLALC
jgi:glutathione S-transferase